MINKNEWKKVKLEDIGEIITGITPSTSNNEFYNKKEIPFYKPNDLVDDKIKFLNEATVYISNLARTKAKIIKEKSVLVTCIGIIGKVAIINREGAFNQQINCITPNESICDINYLAFAIKSKQKYMQYVANSAIVPIINKTQFSNIEILLPNIETQKIISKKLNIIQKIIEMKQQQLFEFEKLVKFQFLKMFGLPNSNRYNFKLGTIRDCVAKIQYGTSKPSTSDGKYKYLRMNNITYDGYLDISDIKTIDVSDSEFEKFSVKYGDVLFNRTNSPELVGKTCVFNLDTPMIIAGYIIKIKVNDKILPVYLSTMLNTSYGKKLLYSISKKSIGQANINAQELQNIKILIPPIELQNKFADFVKQVDKSKVELQKSIDETQLLFDSLMDKYFG